MTPIKPVVLLATSSLTLGLTPAYGAAAYGSQRYPASHCPPQRAYACAEPQSPQHYDAERLVRVAMDQDRNVSPGVAAAPPPPAATSALAHGINANGRVTDHEGEALLLRDRAVDRVIQRVPPRGVRHSGQPKDQGKQSRDHGPRHGG
jgi:hypothetical protein